MNEWDWETERILPGMGDGSCSERRIFQLLGWGIKRADKDRDHHVERVWESQHPRSVKMGLEMARRSSCGFRTRSPVKWESWVLVPLKQEPTWATKQHPSAQAESRGPGEHVACWTETTYIIVNILYGCIQRRCCILYHCCISKYFIVASFAIALS